MVRTGLLVSLLAVLALAAPGQAAVMERADVSSQGTEAQEVSWYSYDFWRTGLSGDGRYVTFQSPAPNLVPDDTNLWAWDVFVRDRLSGITERVSVASDGSQVDAISWHPAISADGRYVAFQSSLDLAPGCLPGAVFMHDRAAGTTECVSVSSAGQPAELFSDWPAISADGRYVAFESSATNLVAGDGNCASDIFVRDCLAGTTQRVSWLPFGGERLDDSHFPAISADGRYLAYCAAPRDGDPAGSGIYLYDQRTGTTEVIAQGATFPGYLLCWPAISADGGSVAFAVVPYNGGGPLAGIYLYDRARQVTECVSVATDGTQGDGIAEFPALSADGQRVAFQSTASNLMPEASNGFPQVYLRDRVSQRTERVSVSRAGTLGNGASFQPVVTDNGRLVAFTSGAGNLVPDDSNCMEDTFVAASALGAPFVVSTSPRADATGVAPAEPVAVSFNEPLAPASVAAGSLLVVGERLGQVTGKLFYQADSYRVVFCPDRPLGADTYTATVVAGAAGVKDLAGNALGEDYIWSFTVVPAAPWVTVVSPVNGSTVRGLVLVQVSAGGADKVEVFMDETLIGTDFSAPYQVAWDTLSPTVSEGFHVIQAIATDALGRKAAAVSGVTVDNATFDDVPRGSLLWPYAEAVAREGIMAGCSTQPPLFCPSQLVARAQLAQYLCRALGLAPYYKSVPTFADVARTHPYYGWIEAIARRGVMQGCALRPLRFCPSGTVSRAVLAVLLCRAAGWVPGAYSSSSFADVPAGSYYLRSVEELYRRHITTGCATKPLRYCPDGLVTKGLLAAFICRTFQIQAP